MSDLSHEDPEHRRLAELNERMIRLWREGDIPGVHTIWESLTIREQRMCACGYIALIAQYRTELGHPPDAEYGPAD
jgi:hypothetical protein